MRRLLINIGGYKGAAIDIAKVLRDLDEAAAAAGWNRIQMTDTLPGYERVRPDAGPDDARPAGEKRPRGAELRRLSARDSQKPVHPG